MIETKAYEAVAQIVSRETMKEFANFHQALILWSKRYNLVAPASLPVFWSRHVLDSVQLFALAPSRAKVWLDFGSGAGFPGMILAIMLREQGEGHMTLVESNRKKAAFLQHCTRITGAPATILQQRIESTEPREIDVITARAVASLDQLLAWSKPFSGPNTVFLFPKGKTAEHELALARRRWDIEAEVLPSCTDNGAGIIKIRKFCRV